MTTTDSTKPGGNPQTGGNGSPPREDGRFLSLLHDVQGLMSLHPESSAGPLE